MKLQISLSAIPLKLAKKAIRSSKVNTARYAEIFNRYGEGKSANKYRIYVPISSAGMHPDKARAPQEILDYLASVNMTLDNYLVGTAILPDGKRTVRLGKVLSKKPELLKMFEKDPQRKGSKDAGEAIVVFSRHPYDILGMSFDRGWTSCMNLTEGSNKHYLKNDIKFGTLVAYLVKNNDKNINNPIGRIAMRPYFNKAKQFILVPSDVYGSAPPEFAKIVAKFVEFFNSHSPGGIYQIPKELYNDNGSKYSLNWQDGFDFSKLSKDEMHSIIDMEPMPEKIMNAIIETKNERWIADMIEYQSYNGIPIDIQIRLAQYPSVDVREELARRKISIEADRILAADPEEDVALQIANKNPSAEIIKILSQSVFDSVILRISRCRNTPPSLLVKLLKSKVPGVRDNAMSHENLPASGLKTIADTLGPEDLDGALVICEHEKATPELLDKVVRMFAGEDDVLRAAAGNPKISTETLDFIFANGNNEYYLMRKIARNPKISREVLLKLAVSSDPYISLCVAQRKKVDADIIRMVGDHLLTLDQEDDSVQESQVEFVGIENLPSDVIMKYINSPIIEVFENVLRNHEITDAMLKSIFEGPLTEGKMSRLARKNLANEYVIRIANETESDITLSRLAEDRHEGRRPLTPEAQMAIAKKAFTVYGGAEVLPYLIYRDDATEETVNFIESNLSQISNSTTRRYIEEDIRQFRNGGKK